MPSVRASRRLTIVVDVVLAAWVAAWIVIGVLVAQEVRGLRQLSTTVSLAGGALRQTGELLGNLERVPFVGGEVGDLAQRVEQTGRSAQTSARASRGSVQDLSILLGVSIALIPSIPLLALWVPLRIGWHRDRQTVRRALDRGDDRIERFLAYRAVQNLPFERLVEVAPDPWADLEAGRYARLAAAERERIGLPAARQAPG